jgi:hypothetical protein
MENSGWRRQQLSKRRLAAQAAGSHRRRRFAGAPVSASTRRLACAFRLAFRRRRPLLSGADENLRRALSSGVSCAGAATERALEKAFFLGTGWSGELAAVQQLEHDAQACNHGLASTMVTVAVKPRPMRVLARGNWQDDKGEIVEPGVPHFLPQIPNPEGRR